MAASTSGSAARANPARAATSRPTRARASSFTSRWLPYRGVEASGRATLSREGFIDVVRRTAARYYGPEAADSFAAAYPNGGVVVRLVPDRLRAWDFKDEIASND